MAAPAIPLLLLMILGVVLAAALVVLIFMYLLVPIFKGLAWLIGRFFWLIGALIMHLARFVGGMFRDTFRAIGAVPAAVIFAVLSVLNIAVGRWSAASHFASSMRDEFTTLLMCVYRVALGHPLRLFGLGGVLEGVEKRVPAAMAEAPGADRPGRRTGQFDGYTIVGSLPGGGSGGRLYIAEPDQVKQRQIEKLFGQCPERVVIKAFAVADGSSLPQIVRESRALECAKQIGLVLEHELTDERFHYVMPYVPGESLGVVTRRLHAKSSGSGLRDQDLSAALEFISDVLQTLHRYHTAGLWHKDIKPENIIIHDGRAHIVDLGLVTPLRSAMTLTTHGTEYFRDPEMVRLALRGVKVHEVDGVKFDIYAAGAVLYYMLENTFPSHGGLSTITKRCPESLKWIVRRAMTDYQRRYESVADIIADIEAVRAHPSMYTMKPAELPSMRDGGVAVETVTVAGGERKEDEAVFAAARAATPQPPRQPERRRPSIEVTNWWTGAHRSGGAYGPRIYGVAGGGDEMKRAARDIRSGVHRMAKEIRQGVAGLRDEVRQSRKRSAACCGPVACGPIPAKGSRPSARAQVANARRRAAERRRQLQTRRRPTAFAPAERVGLSAIAATTVVALLIFLALAAFRPWDRFSRSWVGPVYAPPAPRITVSPAPYADARPDPYHTEMTKAMASLPTGYLLINEHPGIGDKNVEKTIDEVSKKLESIGFSPIDSTETEARLRSVVTQQFSGAVNLSDRSLVDSTERIVGDLLGQDELSDLGCVVWLNWDPKSNNVRFWVMTPDCINSKLDDRLLTYLSN